MTEQRDASVHPEIPLPRRRQALARPRLRQRLDAALSLPPAFGEGFASRLTLVCGPAGFGKTTLVAGWLRDALAAGERFDVAWLTLEPGDDDNDHFAASLVARLKPSGLSLGLTTVLVPTLGNALLADMAARGRPVVLVFDDYHVISSQEIHAFTRYLVERLPPLVHLVLISRADPPLHLARLRAMEEMNELRASDLRFTPDEAGAFLNEIMGLQLTSRDVELLARRTEGWIAGLQLAAYSLSHEDNPTSFISAFAGDDRYIADYLMEEVLLRQPPERLAFLVQTSILERLSADLCNAVTGQRDAAVTLNALERANLFLTPLDNHRQWYRYHRLFADLLRQRLRESDYDPAELHRRAATWFEGQGGLTPAVEHALEAGDHDHATNLILQVAADLFQASRLSQLTRWAARLPDVALARRPRLLLALGWAWIATGYPERAEHCVRLFERAVDSTTAILCESPDSPDLAALPSPLLTALVEAAALWSRLHVNRLEIDQALTYCRCGLRVLEALAADPRRNVVEPAVIAPGDWPPYFNALAAIRPVLRFNMGLALKFVNDMTAAQATLAVAAEEALEQNNVHLIALAFGHLAEAQRLQGQWQQALQACARGLSAVKHLVGELPPLAGILLAEEGVARYELGQTMAAEQLWLRAIELAEPWGNWETLLPAYLGLARLRGFMRRDAAGARDALSALANVTRPHGRIITPLSEAYERAIDAQQAAVPAAASTPAPASSPLPPSALPYLRERQSLCEMQAALAAGRRLPELAHQAAAAAAEIEVAGRLGSALHFYILVAAIYERLGRPDDAQPALQRAHAIARPEGVIIPFLEGGLTGSSLPPTLGARPAVARQTTVRTVDEALLDLGLEAGIIEVPSQREREVLRLIAAGLSNKEIADRLYLTEGTVKNHAHSLYGKLGVTTRTQAIGRARELGLL